MGGKHQWKRIHQKVTGVEENKCKKGFPKNWNCIELNITCLVD